MRKDNSSRFEPHEVTSDTKKLVSIREKVPRVTPRVTVQARPGAVAMWNWIKVHVGGSGGKSHVELFNFMIM